MLDTIPCGQLHTRTLQLVKNRPRTLTLEQIKTDTGLSLAWLKAFSQGLTPDPGVNKVELLFIYLMKATLSPVLVIG